LEISANAIVNIGAIRAKKTRENPFRNLRFKDKILTQGVPFKDDGLGRENLRLGV